MSEKKGSTTLLDKKLSIISGESPKKVINK